MKEKHFFVSLLDLPEILPFTVKSEKDFEKSMKEKERAFKNLSKFVDKLSEKYGEDIYYIGQDIIGEKFLERFLFKRNGFLEVIYAAPTVVIAHFSSKKRAENFANALKETLKEILPKRKVTQLLIESIEVGEEEEEIKFNTWKKMKEIRES